MKRKKTGKKKVEPKKKTVEDKLDNSSSTEKVFDVAHPGTSIPSSSSRPIIVSHKPGVNDPMVSPQAQENDQEEKKEEAEPTDTPSAGEGAEMVMSAPKKNRIEPLHTDITPDEEEAGPEPQEEASETAEPQKGNTDTAPDAADSDASEDISETAAEVTTKKQVQSEAAKKEAEEAKRQAEVESLVNNKQFFVPINAVQKRRSMLYIVIIGILILTVMIVYAALDAEVIDLGIEPPTDIL